MKCTKALCRARACQWPAADRTSPLADGFVFAPAAGTAPDPDGCEPTGTFVHYEPEWYYMVHRPLEAERGHGPVILTCSARAISTVPLEGGRKRLTLTASAETPAEKIGSGRCHAGNHEPVKASAA